MLKRIILSLTFILCLGLILPTVLVAATPGLRPEEGPSPLVNTDSAATFLLIQSSLAQTRPLRINLSNTSPDYVDRQLKSGQVAYGNFDSFGGNCLTEPDFGQRYYAFSTPTLVEATTSLYRRTPAPASDEGTICACGYQAEEHLTVSLINPAGDYVWQYELRTEAFRDYETNLILDYCVAIDEARDQPLMPDALLGQYMVQIEGQDSYLTHSFELEAVTEPVIYYIEPDRLFVLAGFDPFEQVQLYIYDNNHDFIGWTEVTMDAEGVSLLIEADELILVLLRENLDQIIYSREESSGGNELIYSPVDYEQIIAQQPDNIWAYYWFGDFNHLQQAITLDPNFAPAYYKLGEIYANQNSEYYDLVGAITSLSQALERDPNYLPAYRLRGRLYAQQGWYDAAMTDYNRVIELEPDDPNVYYLRAGLYNLIGDQPNRVEDLFQAMELDRAADRQITDFTTIEQEIEAASTSYDYTLMNERMLDALNWLTWAMPDYLPAYYERAKLYQQWDDPAAALEEYSRIIGIDPGAVEAYIERASLYEAQNNYQLALQDYDRLIGLAPTWLYPYMARQPLYEQMGLYEQVLDSYDWISELFPNYLLAIYWRGQLYEEWGDIDRALADYNRIVERDPAGSMVAYYARARLYEQLNEPDLALVDLDIAISLDDNPLGLTYGTLADFDRAIRLDPGYLPAYEKRAELYEIEFGDLPAAIADYNHMIGLDPSNPAYYYDRGRLYEKQGDDAAAVADYTLALELELASNYTDAYVRRADIFKEWGNYSQAIADYSRVIELDPSASDRMLPGGRFAAYQGRAEAYEGLGQLDPAIADCTTILELDPENIWALSVRARLYEEKGNQTGAATDHLFAEEIGQFLLQENAQIIADDTRAIQLDPNNADAFLHRGQIYLEQGDKQKAIADLEKFIELTSDPLLKEQIELQLQELKR